jgi:chemotaxis protein MotB
MRKKKHPAHENHERWLVSYADFMTLLFAFFVVMFAVSQVDSKKMGRFTEAFSKAVGIDVFPLNGESIMAGGTQTDEGATNYPERRRDAEIEDLRAALGSKGDLLRGMQIIQVGGELVLRLPENVFFDSGDARVKVAAVAMLRAVASELVRRAVEVRIEGHTDNRPISSGRFHSNWDLSTARAISVMTLFLDEGLSPNHVSVSGYGEYRPVADNATDEGRRQNRRVDLVIGAIRKPDSQIATPDETTQGDEASPQASEETPSEPVAPDREVDRSHP